MRDTAALDSRKGWTVVAGCCVASIFTLMSILVGALPTLAVDIEADTGWSRGAILGTIGIVVLTGALLGPYVGRLVDRHGGRWWIIGSQVGFSLALVGSASVGDSQGAFYAMILLAAVLAVGSSPVSYAKVIVPWFREKRGMALGLSAVGIGLSAIVLPLITAPLAEAYGWRQTLVIYGMTALIVALPIQFLLVRDFPRDSVGGEDVLAGAGEGFISTFRETWRESGHFRIIILMFFIMGAAHAGIVLNMVPMQEDRGMDKVLAAGTQSALGISLVFGRIIGGWLLDRFDTPKPLLFGIIPAAIGIAMLGLFSDWRLAYLAAILIGLGSGIENDGIPYLISRYFPQKHFAKLSASIQSSSAVALAIGPAIAATTRDVTGNYALACAISTGLLLFTALLVLSLPRYDHQRPAQPAMAT